MKNLFILFCLLISISKNVYSQKLPCGNHELETMGRKENPKYDELNLAFNKQVKNYIAANYSTHNLLPSGTLYTIPVVVHVIKTPGMTYGTGTNISYAQIKSQINSLNVAYAASQANYQGIYSVNTQIQFCLARNTQPSTLAWSLDPSSNVEYGVMRYDVPNLSDPAINVNLSAIPLSQFNPFVVLTNDASRSSFNKLNYFNIWVVDNISAQTGQAAGVYFGNNIINISEAEGVVMDSECFGENTLTGNSFNLLSNKQDGKTLAHEVGHFLAVQHTFYPNSGLNPFALNTGCVGTYAAGSASDQCDLEGDAICDIAPMCASSTGLCNPASRPNSCIEYYTPACGIEDMPNDYMSYESDPCWNTFTHDQKLRMWACLNIKWSHLWTTGNLVQTGLIGTGGCVGNKALVSDITGSDAYACVGKPINFSAVSCYSGNAAVNWNWSMPGSSSTSYISTACASANPPAVTFSSAGTYTISLTVTDPLSATQTSTLQVLVVDCILDPSKKSQANWHFGDYISLDFNTGVPIKNDNTFTPQTSINNAGTLCVSISDNTGSDLYYANGVDAWKISGGVPSKINTTAPLPSVYSTPGINNLGQSFKKATSNSISFPAPGFPNKYYIFNAPDGLPSNLMNARGGYALIDVAGGTVMNQGLLPLPSCAGSEALSTAITAIPHCNGKDYWVIFYSRQNRRFYVYMVTQNGITNNIFTSLEADSYPSCTGAFNADPLTSSQLQLKASPLGNKIAMSGSNLSIYDFNSSTGVISNEIITPHYYGGGKYYGCSFSPNGQYIYSTVLGYAGGIIINDFIIKYDILSNSNSAINLPFNATPTYMQLGPNNHLYFANYSKQDYLNEIPNPDAATGNIAVQSNVSLVTTAGAAGTPIRMINSNTIVNNMDATIPSYVTPDFSVTNIIAGCPTYLFEVNNCYKQYTVSWNYGDGTPTGSGASSTHVFNSPGTYLVTATLSGPLVTYPIVITHTVMVTLTGSPNANAGPSFTICPTGSVTLTGSGSGTYQWLPAAGLSCYTCAGPVASPGTTTVYTLSVTNSCGTSYASTTVTVLSPVLSVTASQYSVCQGAATTLSVSGASTYTWAPCVSSCNTTTLTVSAASSTIYTVTGTNIYGCTATNTVAITVLPVPSISITASSSTICAGQTTTLTASGTSTYSWLPCSSGCNTASLTVTPIATTVYTVTGANSCSATATQTVYVINYPIATTAGSVVGCSSSPLVNIGGPALPNTNYFWLPTTGLSSSTVSNPLANPGAFTVYTLTASNMCGTATNTVAYYQAGQYCCSMPAVSNRLGTGYGVAILPSSFLSYAGSSPLGVADIVISGTLTINQATAWSGVRVRMEPTAKIEITSTGSLKLSNCNLFSCSELWWGIQLLTTSSVSGSISFYNTTVEDMHQGIVADWQNTAAGNPNGIQGSILSTKTLFNKNYISIQVIKNTGYGSSYYPLSVSTTTFNTITSANSPGTTLKPSTLYTYNYNQITNNTLPYVQFPRGFVGVYIAKVPKNTILIGDTTSVNNTNLFNNLDIGIATKDNTTEVKNNNFTNLTGSPNQTGATGLQEIGIGVAADHTIGGGYKLIVGSGNTVPSTAAASYPKGNSFDGCNKGVFSNNVANTIAKGNYLYSSGTPVYTGSLPIPTYYSWVAQSGIWIKGLTATGNISNNKIINLRSGIYLSHSITNSAIGLIAINTNSISSPSASGYCGAAIQIDQPVTTYTLTNNSLGVTQNTIQQVYNGVVGNSLQGGLFIHDNPLISFEQTKTYGGTGSFTRNGIVLNNCYAPTIANNPNIMATGSGVTSGNYTYINGISLTNSYGGVVNCNVVSQTGRCFLFTGNCTNAWLVNSMSASYHGLELNTNGVIGAQGSSGSSNNQSGNLWTTIVHAETFVVNSINVNQSAATCFSPLYVNANTSSPIHTAPILNLAVVSGQEYQTGSTLGIKVVGGSAIYCGTAVPPGGGGSSIIMSSDQNDNYLNENTPDSFFSLYPNPNNGTMELNYRLNSPEAAQLIITDVTSRVLESSYLESTEGKLQINLTALSEGLYFYTIRQGAHLFKKDKFIIIK